MIFVSLGTMDMPFVRMAKAVDEFAATVDEEVIVQTGHTHYEYKNVTRVFEFCTKDEMKNYISTADILILQGGWGAISEAMEADKRIVVIPRHDKTEHIHDQFQLIRKLDSIGCVVGVFDEADLPAAVEKAKDFNFQKIKKGNAEDMICAKLVEWFGAKMILAICLFFSSLTSYAQAEVVESWYKESAKTLVVTNEQELFTFASLVNNGNAFEGKTIQIAKDIDLSSAWTPIGNPSKPFKGNFDGSFHKITIHKINESEYSGLFGYVSGGNISNTSVSVKEPFTGATYFGSVVGFSDENSTIKYCVHEDRLVTHRVRCVGGVVGCSRGTIHSCSNHGAMTVTSDSVCVMGGVVGEATGKVQGCYNDAYIMCSNIAGGIVGYSYSSTASLSLLSSFNEGNVSVVNQTAPQNGEFISGGLIGKGLNVAVRHSYNNASVTTRINSEVNSFSSYRPVAGGILGLGSGNITFSYNRGRVVANSDIVSTNEGAFSNILAGGFVGLSTMDHYSRISYCYNAGNVEVAGNSNYGAYYNFGGIVGDFESFQPVLNVCYTLDGSTKNKDNKIGYDVSILKNMEINVSEKKMKSEQFVHTSNNYVTINDSATYLFDDFKLNDGFPVLKQVITAAPHEKEGKYTFVGHSSAQGISRGFHYWVTGMEEFDVSVEADENFEADFGKLAKGMEHNYYAYIETIEGEIIRGEIVHFFIPDIKE